MLLRLRAASKVQVLSTRASTGGDHFSRARGYELRDIWASSSVRAICWMWAPGGLLGYAENRRGNQYFGIAAIVSIEGDVTDY